MTLYAILVVGLAIWIWGLWRRGFFGPETPVIDRQVYALRLVFWFISLLIVSVPLRQHREQIGTVAYVGLAFVILAVFYWLGMVASRALTKRHDHGSS